MSSNSVPPPCVFISYSWTTPTHETWVLKLAERLMEDGIEVRLDKWDLLPGHDSYAFMESMVTDPTVTKVLMICDKAYAGKADKRAGGVGTESQIISPELYGKTSQDRYAAVMTDEDELGNAHVPVFYRGRIFFDFRSGDRYEESYEQLLRWLADKPQFVKPKLGKLPEHIMEARPVASGTRSAHQRALRAIEEGSTQAAAHVRSFGVALVGEIRQLLPVFANEQEYDETILASVAAIRPYLHQLAELSRAIVRFGTDAQIWERLLGILEQLAQLGVRQPDQSVGHSWAFDAAKMAAHDAFLSALATALDDERFDLASRQLSRPWLLSIKDGANRPSTSDFTVFREHLKSLEYRNSRLKLNRISIAADLVREAHNSGALPAFESIMQADFVCYLRGQTIGEYYGWYPETLVYSVDRFSPFPIFARAESREFLERMLPVLAMPDLAGLRGLIEQVSGSARNSNLFDRHGLPITYLANREHLGTRD